VAGRVLHVAHHALPHVGGLERVAEAETTALAARGWQVALVTSATGATPGTSVDRGVRARRVRAWNGLEERHGVPFPLFSPRLVGVLLREVRRADVVHLHDALYLSSWIAAAWCWLLRTPYVVHRHVGFVHHSSLLVRAVQRLVLATLARLVMERAALVVAIDEPIAEEVRRSVATPVTAIGNGVDADRFRPAERGERDRLRTGLDLPAEESLILFVGRPVPKKGFPLVAGAAGERYRIVVAGGDRPAGTDPRVLFLGTVDAERMPEVYRCADALVVASVGECPLTVLEALSSGVPVVLVEDPALHSPWTSGPGVWFADPRREPLSGVLEKLVADPVALERAGAAGRDFVRHRFSWDAHLDALESAYGKALATSR